MIDPWQREEDEQREWKRHPAQIELLQTIVLKLDEIIDLLKGN